MAKYTEKQIELAGRIVKVLYLARQPAMDLIAIKLNSNLTHTELMTAQRWAAALDLAEHGEGRDLIELAGHMNPELLR